MLRIVLVALVILTGGCATVQPRPLDPAAEQTLAGRRLTAARYKKPDFTAMTAGKAMFGLFGAAAMISAGNKIIEENRVEDPAAAIADELMKGLEKKYRTVRLAGPATEAESDDLDALVKLRPEAEVLLDVRTLGWSFMYFPTNWARYRVTYAARARLIDARSKTVLAEGKCERVPEQTDNAPTHDELLNDNAAGLKRELQTAAAACIETLKTETFHLAVTGPKAVSKLGP